MRSETSPSAQTSLGHTPQTQGSHSPGAQPQREPTRTVQADACSPGALDRARERGAEAKSAHKGTSRPARGRLRPATPHPEWRPRAAAAPPRPAHQLQAAEGDQRAAPAALAHGSSRRAGPRRLDGAPGRRGRRLGPDPQSRGRPPAPRVHGARGPLGLRGVSFVCGRPSVHLPPAAPASAQRPPQAPSAARCSTAQLGQPPGRSAAAASRPTTWLGRHPGGRRGRGGRARGAGEGRGVERSGRVRVLRAGSSGSLRGCCSLVVSPWADHITALDPTPGGPQEQSRKKSLAGSRVNRALALSLAC